MSEVEQLRQAFGVAKDSVGVLMAIARNIGNIEFIKLVRLESTSVERMHLRNLPEVEAVVPEALRLRSSYGISFWMAVLLEANARKYTIPEEVLESAMYHQSMAQFQVHMEKVNSLTQSGLREVSDKLSQGETLVLTSRVQLAGGASAHIPMLDFRSPFSEETKDTVIRVLRRIGIGGVVLNSGQSFHFYGDRLLSEDEMTEFLGRALLFTPLVDHRWIAHQLIERNCALRISPNSNGILPAVVAVL